MQWERELGAHGLEPAPMEAFQSLPLAQLSKARLDDRLTPPISRPRQRMVK
jgi:hypothetical protein